MAGGQKGLSFVGEPMVFAIIATFVITVLLQLQLGCLSTGADSPRAESNVECEEAWAAEYDGDDDTVNETAILEQSWCQEHLDMVESGAGARTGGGRSRSCRQEVAP